MDARTIAGEIKDTFELSEEGRLELAGSPRDVFEVHREGRYATFGRGNHICLDMPSGRGTISVRASCGRLLTFAFVPRDDDESTTERVEIFDHGFDVACDGSPVARNALRVLRVPTPSDQEKSTAVEVSNIYVTSLLLR